ncbi:telomere length regulation protein TEL2 homolog [Arctopsyche grandis]|uniref:telomere length regulation protein TEL2 homolog n=1 Tax=Arctopsyche grandis TaxID=121162 RepID=UPI00406D7E7B
MDRIKSNKDVVSITGEIGRLRFLLPGHITPQRLCGQDKSLLDWPVFAETIYSALLDALLTKFESQWPLRNNIIDENVASLFLIEDCFEFSLEILSSLCTHLKLANKHKLLSIVEITKKYLKSDTVFIAIVNISLIENETDLATNKSTPLFSQWQKYVQFLISLPHRIANCLQRDTPKEFILENYCSILVFHVVRAIDFMSDSCFYADTKYSLKFLSYILSKIIVNFNDCCNSRSITSVINIFVSWTMAGPYDVCSYLKKRLIQNVLENLSRSAIEVFSVMILRNVPLDYFKRSPQSILLFNMLGRAVRENKDWEYVLCTKIPVMSDYSCKDTLLVENLILYLSIMIDKSKLYEDNILSDLILRLLSSWSSRSGMLYTSFNQRIFITQALLLAINYLSIMTKFSINIHIVSKIKTNLYDGVSMHLDSIDPLVRCLGMATAELSLNMLILSEPDGKERPMLKFDYEDFSDECQELYDDLYQISKKCVFDSSYVPTDVESNITIQNGFKILEELGVRIFDESNDTVVLKPLYIPTVSVNKNPKCKIEENEPDAANIKMIENLELDSDDDLEPYDMSDDLPDKVKKRPGFLRDLRDNLVESSDQEVFSESLLVAEELVYQQLPNDDFQLGVELLDLLVHLEKKYAMDNFDEIRTSACIAIVCIYPMTCAEHLCREFHMPVGKYSIFTRLLLLDILAGAADRMSRFAPVVEMVKIKPNVKITDDRKKKLAESALSTAERIILQRLESKTKYFHSKSVHPFSKARKNTFTKVASSFFYPLLYGFGKHQLTLAGHCLMRDSDNIVLQKFLSVVSVVLISSKNSIDSLKFVVEALNVIWCLRYNRDSKIQAATIVLLVAAVSSVSADILRTHCHEQLVEMKMWLSECHNSTPNCIRTNDFKECEILAKSAQCIIENLLFERIETVI